tara:strand:+ start:1389 stop:2027 length:639 start_codon:yes stop_codon:yes gene_type:complete
MSNGKFASSGIVVGHTRSSNREQRLQHMKGARVTMGFNVPRSGEGAVGDITIRTITNKGFRAFVKTNSGWIDLNSMVAPDIIEWRDMVLATNITHDSDGLTPQYTRDTNGFVHLRGLIDIAGGDVTIDITTLPPGYRPSKDVYVSGVHANGSGGNCIYKIDTDGVINSLGGANANKTSLHGVSFFAWQDTSRKGGGGGGHQPDPGSGGGALP